MKKLYLLVTIFTFLIFRCNVYASSFSLTLDGDSTFSDEISIDVTVSGLSGFTDGFYGLDATLSYDKTKIELKEITSTYDLTYDKTKSDRFVVLTGEGVNNNTKLCTLVFKNKSLSAGDSVTISLTNLIGSDGEEDISISSVPSKTVSLNDNANTYIKGDMNKDGDIGLQDVIILLRKYLNVESSTSEDIQIGDMNEDGEIGLQDVIMLLRVYLGVN